MSSIRLFVDQDIVAVDAIFSQLGELHKKPGRAICREDLLNIDVLVIRSTTRVDVDLLAGTSVKFVASATSGTDHVELDYLKQAGIGFADAKGANANAVVEYCITAMAILAHEGVLDLKMAKAGIVGAGQVGSRLAIRLAGLGIPVICNDPLLTSAQRAMLTDAGVGFADLDTVLRCPVVSFHVPLTMTGEFATYHMMNEERLNTLSSGAVLLNTSRAEVLDSRALKATLKAGRKIHTVLDVWENEPTPDPKLVKLATLATPHIAGYSQQAKLAASLQAATAVANHFHLPCAAPTVASHVANTANTASNDEIIGYSAAVSVLKPGPFANDDPWCASLLSQVLDIAQLSADFKSAATITSDAAFDGFRRQLQSRQEFVAHTITGLIDNDQALLLQRLGFNLDQV